MLKLIFLSYLIMALISGGVNAGRPPEATDLGQYRWKNRLLFLFSPSPVVPAYQSLDQELRRNPEGAADRDLLVFRVLEQGPSALGSQEISPQDAANLQRLFGVSPGAFKVVLVGKDGGGKLERSGLVTLSEIFTLIDSMPMRQREMQGK